MPHTFDHIVAIYNPNSTNDAASKAKAFQASAKKAGFTVKLYETERAGHAEEIAHEAVKKYDTPLIISVSGDGGYNEVINGVMQAKSNSQKQPTVAILAAGNANDHKRTTRGDTSLISLLKKSQPRPMDLLRLQADSLDRYAHSYIGLGITPEVGIELNKHDLNTFREIQLVLSSFMKFTPFAIQRDGKRTRYANLLFANIAGMSKVIKLDTEDNSLRDGKFELIAHRWHGKLWLLLHLLRLVIFGNPHAPQLQTYTFTTLDPTTPVQLDGEIEELSKDIEVTISAAKNAVLSLY